MSGRNTGEKTENILIKVFKPCIMNLIDKLLSFSAPKYRKTAPERMEKCI